MGTRDDRNNAEGPMTIEVTVDFLSADSEERRRVRDFVLSELTVLGFEDLWCDAYRPIRPEEGEPPNYDDFLGGAINVFPENPQDADRLFRELMSRFPGRLSALRRDIPEAAWRDAWRVRDSDELITDAFHVINRDIRDLATADIAPNRQAIFLVPSSVFGDGAHATTEACLWGLEDCARQLVDRGCMLDVGTGNGILAIAGSCLGFRQVVAIDVDGEAIDIARKNAAVNDIASGSMTILHGGLETIADQDAFDLVVCNILPPVLERLLPAMSGVVKVDGRLLLAGITTADIERVESVAVKHHLKMNSSLSIRGWSCLTFEKISG